MLVVPNRNYETARLSVTPYLARLIPDRVAVSRYAREGSG